MTTSTTKAFCSVCSGPRNHVVLHSVITKWSTDDDQHGGAERFETLQCAGCESIKLRNTSTYSWNDEETVTYFPPPMFRPRPRWYIDLQLSLMGEPATETAILPLLNEIYIGLQNGMTRSPAMAARALLEHVMLKEIGDQGTFAANVDKFEQAGFVSARQKERLLTILEAGHATIHRAYSPTKEDLVTILDIVEHLIESIYIHGAKVTSLQGRVPPRVRR
jgi:Domain of unknown function (DUF4145)